MRVLTQDWQPIEWAVLMGWRTHVVHVDLLEDILKAYASHQGVHNAAQANSLSVTRADGLDWLRTVLKRCPWYRGPVPVWTRRALRELREERGCKTRELGQHLDLERGVAELISSRLGGWIADKR